MSPRLMKTLINLWGPFLGAGVKVEKISADYREVVVALKQRWYNRNYVGTHFGGSLFAMTDPFYMLMLMQLLGRDYFVWDKSASIEFISPGRGTVRAHFELNDNILSEIREQTAGGEKYLPELPINIVNDAGELVARVTKTLYIKRKPGR
ncbi:DUF4442 domain-containing protein [Chitinivorax sp. PXF-14]|uniref:DUF4442 domain-containing protein n=1 Tax=Chitinivorax sp. PXF-14 TaxID=3230488 RepID=UPI0034667A90